VVSSGNVAIVPTPPGGGILAKEVTAHHKIFRCTMAPPKYSHNAGIVVVFPPDTPLSSRIHMSHYLRGEDLGLYEPIRFDQITFRDINRYGKLRSWSLP
jgi:hypothetical protein